MSWLLLLSLLALACIPLGREVAKQRKAADRTKALGNSRQIGVSLFEFEEKYGRYPDATTAPIVKAGTGTPLSLDARTSNGIFRQFIATGLKSEVPFYARIAGTKKPDNLFQDDAHAIAPGECGFAYVAGLTSKADPSTPIVVSPLIPGTTRFDPEPFDGKAVILRVDNSSMSMAIDPSGRVMTGGLDLFDPAQPWWGGTPPDIKWQE